MTQTMIAERTTTRRVATYARVSSDDQAERGTIRTQLDELERRLAMSTDIHIVERYADDGVSGMIGLTERPDGRRLMADAAAGRFDELHVYALDRLGRDFIDLATTRRTLEGWGVRLISVVSGEPDLLSFDIQAAVADHARRAFLKVSAAGMDRAAREGRYTGGVVPYGYRVEGIKPDAYLVPDENVVWQGMTAVDIIARIYRSVGLEDRSCRQVAAEFDALGIPTHSALQGRGKRTKGTRAVWRAGRVRNMIVQPIYRGELAYGRRTKGPREVITASVAPLVSPALWQAAQEALARHRICAKNTDRVYLMRGVMVCTTCCLTYVGSSRKGTTWYRCGGQIHERGAIDGRCPGRGIKGDHIEPLVWRDIERFLRDPGDLLEELDNGAEHDGESARRADEMKVTDTAIADLALQRGRAQGLAVRGAMSDEELDTELARIERERAVLERHRETLEPAPARDERRDTDLLDQLRSRLDSGLSDQQRQQIVRLLIGRISITTTVNEDHSKDVDAMIDYRFPDVLSTRTGTGSSPR